MSLKVFRDAFKSFTDLFQPSSKPEQPGQMRLPKGFAQVGFDIDKQQASLNELATTMRRDIPTRRDEVVAWTKSGFAAQHALLDRFDLNKANPAPPVENLRCVVQDGSKPRYVGDVFQAWEDRFLIDEALVRSEKMLVTRALLASDALGTKDLPAALTSELETLSKRYASIRSAFTELNDAADDNLKGFWYMLAGCETAIRSKYPSREAADKAMADFAYLAIVGEDPMRVLAGDYPKNPMERVLPRS